jgi:hypothetical protein
VLPESTSVRLATQLDVLPTILGDASPAALTRRPPSGDWSAHENLAHLARHHEVMLDRLRRILTEDTPRFSRYRAEDDPEWPAWPRQSLDAVLARLTALRAELLGLVRPLGPDRLDRAGVHPVFGLMTIPLWLEFFLLHEAHHLYVVLNRVRGG